MICFQEKTTYIYPKSNRCLHEVIRKTLGRQGAGMILSGGEQEAKAGGTALHPQQPRPPDWQPHRGGSRSPVQKSIWQAGEKTEPQLYRLHSSPRANLYFFVCHISLYRVVFKNPIQMYLPTCKRTDKAYNVNFSQGCSSFQ